MSGDGAAAAVVQRIDQWLWFARLVKSRTLAQAIIERGKVRLNRARLEKASQQVKPGDVITISLGPRVRVVEIKGIGRRRGPAAEAAVLYAELTERYDVPKNPGGQSRDVTPGVQVTGPAGIRAQGSGRPTKRERRAIDRLKGFEP